MLSNDARLNNHVHDDDPIDLFDDNVVGSLSLHDVRLLTLLGENLIDLHDSCWRHRPDLVQVLIDNADSPPQLVASKTALHVLRPYILPFQNYSRETHLQIAEMILKAAGDNAADLILTEQYSFNVLEDSILEGNDDVTRLYIDQLAREGRDIFGNDPYGRDLLQEGILTRRPAYLNIL